MIPLLFYLCCVLGLLLSPHTNFRVHEGGEEENALLCNSLPLLPRIGSIISCQNKAAPLLTKTHLLNPPSTATLNPQHQILVLRRDWSSPTSEMNGGEPGSHLKREDYEVRKGWA